MNKSAKDFHGEQRFRQGQWVWYGWNLNYMRAQVAFYGISDTVDMWRVWLRYGKHLAKKWTWEDHICTDEELIQRLIKNRTLSGKPETFTLLHMARKPMLLPATINSIHAYDGGVAR